jgi:hypothetical protein
MANLSYIPSFYFYRFADAVSGPYTALNAYSSGIIDRNGNIKGNESSIDPFEYFVIKLKKIFDQLPPGTTKYKLQNLMGTLQVFNEEFDLPEISKEQLNSLIESHIMINAEDGVSYLNLLEDMSTGSAGGGAGTIGTPAEAPGANKGNVSGYDPVMMPMMSRSGPVNMFPSIEMFNVSKSEFDAFKAAKAWKQLQDSKTKKYLQRFQRRNKNGKMAVRDEESGEIFFIPYNEKSLVEQFNLENLDILNENKKITDIFKNLMVNANYTPESGIKPIAGSKEEHTARMVHAIRSLHAAKTGGEKGLDLFISSFDDLSKKETSENGPDAVEIKADKSGDLRTDLLDVKGINTSIRRRADEPLKRNLGITQQIADLSGELQREIKKIPQETFPTLDVKTIKKITDTEKVRGAKSSLEDAIKKGLSRNVDLKTIRDYIRAGYNLEGAKAVNWSVLQPASKKVKLTLSPEPETGKTKLPAILSANLVSDVLGDPKIIDTVTVKPRVVVKKEKTGEVSPEIDVWARGSDLSPKKRQAAIETTAKNMGTGNIIHADINDEMIETMRKHLSDEELFSGIVQHVQGFIR